MTTVILRADATQHVGTGHVMRCIALAEVLVERGVRCVFCSTLDHPWIQERVQRVASAIVPVPLGAPDLGAAALVAHAQQEAARWIVLDGYHFTSDYRELIQQRKAGVLVIDDHGTERYTCDVVINPNLYGGEVEYSTSAHTMVSRGPAFAMLRGEFRKAAVVPREVTGLRMLVTLGGADPNRRMLHVLEAVGAMSAPVADIRVIVGGIAEDDGVEDAARAIPGTVHVLRGVDNMVTHMQWANCAITAAGTTVLEYCRMGVPMAAGIIADNQVPVAAGVAHHGVGINVGWFAEQSAADLAARLDRWVLDEATRREQGQRGARLVDGRGTERIADIMLCEAA